MCVGPCMCADIQSSSPLSHKFCPPALPLICSIINIIALIFYFLFFLNKDIISPSENTLKHFHVATLNPVQLLERGRGFDRISAFPDFPGTRTLIPPSLKAKTH